MSKRMSSLGPWATRFDSESPLGLSTFWRQRMRALATLNGAVHRTRRRVLISAATVATLLTALPLVEFTPGRVLAEEAAPETPAVKDQGSPLLRELQAAGAPLLKQLADAHGYALADGQAIRRVAPPFPDVRMDWYLAANPGQAEAIPTGPDGIIFHWQGNELKRHGMTFGQYNVEALLTWLAEIYPQRVEGPKELLATDIPGDWVLRPDAPPEKVVEQLEVILNDELTLGIRLRWGEVERDVYVAKGAYKFTPLPGQPGSDATQLTERVSRTDPIQVFGDKLAPNSGGGGGTGPMGHYYDWLGRWIGFPIVDESEPGSPREVSWKLHQTSPFSADEYRRAHDAELVLANITKQTGVTFVREKRPIKVLVVERNAE